MPRITLESTRRENESQWHLLGAIITLLEAMVTADPNLKENVGVQFCLNEVKTMHSAFVGEDENEVTGEQNMEG